jgi:DNA-binding protein Fis
MCNRATSAGPHPEKDQRKKIISLAMERLGAHEINSVKLDHVVDSHLVRVVEACDGNRSAAAAVLGVDRRTLQRMLCKRGVPPLPKPPVRGTDSESATKKEKEPGEPAYGAGKVDVGKQEPVRARGTCAVCGEPVPLPPWPIDPASLKCIEHAVFGVIDRRPADGK